MSVQQVLRNKGENIPLYITSDGEAVDADGDVTVSVTNASGTEIYTDQATTHGTIGSGLYTYALPKQVDLDYLRLGFSYELGGLEQTDTHYVEIVGDFYFTLKQLRDSDSALANTTKFPAAKLAQARLDVQAEFESICRGRSFVPRYHLATLSGYGTNSLMLPHLHVTTVRLVRVTTAGVGTAFTNDELADLAIYPEGVILRNTGVFLNGAQNVTVGYEHGLPVCPPDVNRVAMLRAKELLMQPLSGIHPRTETFTEEGGGSTRFFTPPNYVMEVLDRYPGLISIA